MDTCASRPFLAPPEELFQPEFSAWADLGPEAGASYLLYYDELTGLPNHRWWTSRLEAEVQRSRSERVPLAALWMGVDSLRALDEEYGSRQADHVLACLASLLREGVGDRGHAVRLGGDEFAVLLPGLGREDARVLAGGLLDRLRSGRVRLLDSALEVTVTASLGLACWPEDVPEPGEVARRAERAGRRAKREGRNRLVVAGAGEGPERPRHFPCPRLVGRGALLDQLREALPARPVLVLRGPPGSGRTRLLEGLGAPGDLLLLAGAGQAAQVDQPFGCLARALEAALASSPHLQRTLVSALSPEELGAAVGAVPSLAPVAARPGDPAPALARMLAGLSQARPVLLRLDDADWCDPGTLRVLERLLQEEWAPAVILVLGTDEPAHEEALAGYLEEARRGGLLRELEVPPLEPAEVAEMVAEILPGPRPLPPLVNLVARRSAGSPLLVQECLHLLLEADRLVDREGGLGVREVEREEGAPVLQARSAALPLPVRTLLARASAFGSEFGLPELSELVGRDESRVRGTLEEAVRADVLAPGETPDRYRFTSTGLQETLYGTLDPEARLQVHGALAAQARGSERVWHLRRAGREAEADTVGRDLQAPFQVAALPEPDGLGPDGLVRAGHLAHLLRRLLMAIRMYGPEHPEVRAAQEELLGLARELLERVQHLEMAEAGGVVRANGLPLGAHAPVLALAGLRSLTLARGLTLAELQAFSRALAGKREGRSVARELRDHGVVHLVPDEDLYVPARDLMAQELQDLGASLQRGEMAPEDLDRLRNLRQELANWYEELSRYANLEFLDALSQDWDVLGADLGSQDRVRVAAASRAFLAHPETGRYRLVQLVTRTADERVRKVAGDLLRRMGDEAADDLLEALHRSSVDEERCRLLEVLAGIPGQAVDEQLLAFVSHPARSPRRESLRALEGRPVPGLEEELERLVRRGQPVEVRIDAIEGAERCRLTGLVPVLGRLVRRRSILWPEDDASVQAAACRALGTLGGPEVLPGLLRALQRPWPLWWTKPDEVRAAAALALADLRCASLGDRRVRRPLALARRSRHSVVRSAAKLAWRRLKRRAAR